MDRELQELRAQIDLIDTEILQKIAARCAIVKKMGQFKKKKNLPLIDKDREQLLLQDRSKKAVKLHLSADCTHKLFRLLIQEARKIQKE